MRNLKKVVALVAVFAMMVSTVAFAQTFTDVDAEHDYVEAIEMLSNLEILTGDDQDGDGKMDFRPEDKITRAEVAVIISRIQGINNAAQVTTDFADVPSSHWASGYVAQAAGQGIVNGYGDGNFGPEDNVLYEQAVKMFVETLGYAPFVKENGGYPTGHLTAAQRYGVAEGVIGGTTGVEATRGQIAQLAYNAIDTPLMDRSVYGDEAQYKIFDGEGGREFMTLLTRNLGVKKFAGVVTANQVTSITAAVNPIKADEIAEVKVKLDDEAKVNTYYKAADMKKLYVNGSGIDELLGQYVTGYAVEAGRGGAYEVIAATASDNNDIVELSIAQFIDYSAGKIEYKKNETDRLSTTIEIASTPYIFVNGVLKGDKNEDVFTELEKAENKAASGKITIIDNGMEVDGVDGIDGYKFIFVEVGTSLVVDEVSANGRVTFKNNVTTNPVVGKKISLVFDEEDEDQIIELTKNGEAIDYTELKEWDVLSILANYKNEYYVAEVIEAGKVEGSITSAVASATSAYDKYTINGEKYDVALNAYECDKLQPGSAGTFYIDNYGKIVAFEESGSTIVSDKYGYIVEAKEVDDPWDDTKKVVKVQILDKSGEVYEAYLADTVKIENKAASAFIKAANLATYATKNTYNADHFETANLVALLKNAFVTYDANSNGEVKTITFAQTSEDENSLYHDAAKHAAEDVEYDADEAYIKIGAKKFDVAEDTIVFYITNADKNVYDQDSTQTVNGSADITLSKVDALASLVTDTYEYVEIYDAYDDEAAVIVVYDETAGIDNSSSIAFVEATGTAIVGDEIVTSVEYYKDGEKLSATVDVNYKGSAITAGNAYRFAMNADGTIINNAEIAATFAARPAGEADEDGIVAVTGGSVAAIGPVAEYVSRNNSIRIATLKSPANADAPYNFEAYTTIKVADANVYVYDPVRANNKIAVADASDVEWYKELIEQTTGVELADTVASPDVAAGHQALGMMDFVASFEDVDGDVTDVIIFKAYDFGRWDIVVTP